MLSLMAADRERFRRCPTFWTYIATFGCTACRPMALSRPTSRSRWADTSSASSRRRSIWPSTLSLTISDCTCDGGSLAQAQPRSSTRVPQTSPCKGVRQRDQESSRLSGTSRCVESMTKRKSFSRVMNEITELLNQWQLDEHEVRERMYPKCVRMYRAPSPRERERWHAVWLLARG